MYFKNIVLGLKANKKAPIPGQGRELTRGTTLIMNVKKHIHLSNCLNATKRQCLAALQISLLLLFTEDSFQPRESLS